MRVLKSIALASLMLSLLLAGSVYSHNHKKPAKKKTTNVTDAPFWTGALSVTQFEKLTKGQLDQARQALTRMLAVKGPRTIENTLKPYDEIILHLDNAASQSSLIEEVHPDKTMRAAAEKLTQEASAFGTELSLNRQVYDALVALDVKGADAPTQYYVEKTRRDFRLAGVDKDEATRAKIKALRDELVEIGQEFSRNIRNGGRTVTVDDAGELAGLPKDYIERHKPDASGKIVLTTDYPDALPIFSYAKSEELRKEMYMAYNNRAYPENIPVLDRLIAKRHELANLLGFANWADYITADKMVGSGKKAADFIDRIVKASGSKAESEYKILLKQKQQDAPGAKVVNAWESTYYSEQVRKANYDFDSQKVRPYFPYQRVKQGVLDVTSKLFGVTFKQVKNAPVWHPSVELWEMHENGKLAGLFYLDMHPREGKYKHAAQFNIRSGVAGKQLPAAALVCNFPGGEPGDPGLMDHGDVQTFFHEFGHLLHTLFASRGQWAATAGISTERDFVEAPSQMLEEWAWDPATLATFAKQHQTNEPIPAALVKQMKRASEFGKGLQVRRQMVYAKYSLSVYDRDPAKVKTDELAKQITERYQPFPFVEGTHFQTAFGHLDGYSAVYYTYMWSLVIAKDLFSHFDSNNLMAPKVAERYREYILAPGGSAPAEKLVQSFLGRPVDFKAWEKWLNEGD